MFSRPAAARPGLPIRVIRPHRGTRGEFDRGLFRRSLSGGPVMAKVSSDTRSLRINTTFVESPADGKLPASAAYAYSAGGRLLASAEVDAKSGHANLQLPTSSEPTGVRVLVGPALPRGEEPEL